MKRKIVPLIKSGWIALLLIMMSVGVEAQTVVTMRNHDSILVSACMEREGFIVDDGGFSSNYSNSFDGWVTLNAEEGCAISLNIHYNTEFNYDLLEIFDSTTTALASLSGEGATTISSNGGTLRIHFTSDGGANRSGFEIRWTVSNNGSTCEEGVTNLIASNITATTADLSWDGTSTSYYVYVDGVRVALPTATNYSLSELTASRYHSVMVSASGNHDACCIAMTGFRSSCDDVHLPYSEKFNDLSEGIMPSCWERWTNFDDPDAQPALVDMAQSSGDNALMLSCGSNSTASHFGLVASPAINTTDTWHIKLRLRASHMDTRVILGLCTNSDNDDEMFDFTPLDTFSFADNNTWYTYQAQWTPSYSNSRIAIKMVQGMQDGIGRRVYIDDISISQCGIDSIWVIQANDNSFSYIWSYYGNPSQVSTFCMEEGTNQFSTHNVYALATLVSISELSSSETTYQITATPSCGSRAGESVQLVVRTPSSAYDGERYCLGFYGVTEVPNNISIIGSSASVSNNQLLVDAWGTNAIIATPPINNLAGKDVSVRFSGYYPTLIIGTLQNIYDISTFTPIDTIQGGYYKNHYASCRIPSSSTANIVALKVSSDFRLSSLEVSPCVIDSCRVIHQRGTSVMLKWATLPTGNDEVKVEYGPAGFELGSGTELSTTNNNITIGGLSPLTDYEFIVYRPCGGEACGNIRLSARTVSTDYPIPFCEDFDEMESVQWENDWYKREVVRDCPLIDQQHQWSGGKSLEMVAYDGFGSVEILPDVILSEDNIISFSAFSRAPEAFVELVSFEEAEWNADWKPIDTVRLASPGHWARYTMTVPDTVEHRLGIRAFHNQANSMYRIWIDDLHIERASYEYADFYNATPHSVGLATAMLGTTDSLDVLLVSGDDTLHRIRYNSNDTIEGLEPCRQYTCYIHPIASDEACISYAGTFFTPCEGGGDVAGCLISSELTSDELPDGWAFDEGEHWSLTYDSSWGNILVGQTPTALALPYVENSNTSIHFAAKGSRSGQYLIVGAPTDVVVSTDNVLTSYLFATVPDTIYLDSADWHLYSIDLSNLPEWGHRVVIEASGLHSNGQVMISRMLLGDRPNVTLSIDGNRLTCTTEGAPIDYLLQLIDSSDTITYHIVEPVFEVNNLKMNTEYLARWYFNDSDSSCAPQTIFRTEGLLPLPYCETFDNEGNNIPSIWEFAMPSGSHVSYNYWNNTSLTLSPANGEWMYAILPPTVIDSSLSVIVNVATGDSGSFEIGVLNIGADTSSFTAIATNLHNEWFHEIGADLYPYRGKRIALRCRQEVSLDKILISNTPLVHSSLIAGNRIKLWTEYGGNYLLQWQIYNTNCSSSANQELIADSVLYLTDTCPGSYTWPNRFLQYSLNPDSLNSLCNPEYQKPFYPIEQLPFCYQFSTEEHYNEWHWPHEWGQNDAAITHEDNETMVRFDCSQSQFMLFPDFDIDSIRSIGLKISYRSQIPSDRIIVGIMTDAYDTLTFSPIDTLVGTNNEWNEQVINLTRYTGDGRWIAFHTTNRPEGRTFDVRSLIADRCIASVGASVSLYRHNIVKIDNPYLSNTDHFFVEYGLHGFEQGSGTKQRIDTTPAFLTLENETDYDFYFLCDSTSSSCAPTQTITTLCPPLPVPTCIDFDTNATDTLPHCWFSRNDNAAICDTLAHSGTQSLRLSTNGQRTLIISPDVNIDSLQELAISLWIYALTPDDRISIGCMANPYDNSTFHPIRTLLPTTPGQWQRFMVDFSSVPDDAHFIALRALGTDGSALFVDDIYLSDCGAYGLHAIAVGNDSIVLDWNQVGHPDMRITMLENGYTSRIFTGLTSHPLTIRSLQPQHRYSFILTSVCDDNSTFCSTDYHDTITIITPNPADGCINPTDMHSSNVVYYSGSFGNPYAMSGAIDYGSNSPDSRHTIHYDTAERDPRTNNLLRTVPDGASSSVRLGNWSSNPFSPESEGVVYSLFVDTMSFDIIVMRYAAVLQNPMHDPNDQPRFRLELLDSNMHLINPECTSADFIANRDLGWNMADNNILWHDWTTLGIDLSAFANQTVYLRLTTFDCNEGSHFGYAYFTLDCLRKEITSDRCGETDSITFTAPMGFVYRWTPLIDSTNILSTSQFITVPSEDITYTCHISFIDNPNCAFNINAYAGTRYPLARMDTATHFANCVMTVNFTNTSTLSSDGITPLPNGGNCESAYWDFGNGQSSTDYHATATYYESGSYDVTLIVSIAGGQCADTLHQRLDLFIPSARRFDTIYACQHYSWHDTTLTTSGDYTDTLPYVNNYGCDSIELLHLIISQPDTTEHSIVIDHSQMPYSYEGHTFDQPIETYLNFPQPNGCDHVVHLTLDVTSHLSRDICDSQLPYTWHNVVFRNSDSATVVEPSTLGGHNIITLVVTVHPTYEVYDTLVICPGYPFEYMGVDYGGPIDFVSMQHTAFDCDSIVHVSLRTRDASFAISPLFSFDSIHWTDDTVIVGCAPTPLFFYDTTPNAFEWHWTLQTPDTLFQGSDSLFLTHFDLGYDYTHSLATLIVGSGQGCYDTIQRRVYIFRSPIAEFEWDPYFPAMHDPQVHFLNRSQPTGLDFLWQIESLPGGNFDTTSRFEPTYYWGEIGDDMTGDYNVNLIAYWTHLLDDIIYTCTDTSSRIVTITNDNLQFPNLVTPNGDGHNDTWGIYNLVEYHNYPLNELWIYNQWGVLVYHVKNISTEKHFWDPNATSSPDGTYYYRFTAKGPYGLVKRNGVIEVLRD